MLLQHGETTPITATGASPFTHAVTSVSLELGAIQNDTDTQTDYFDSDKVYLEPGDKYYDEALAAYNKRRLADSKRFLKHDEKRLQKELDSGCPYEFHRSMP